MQANRENYILIHMLTKDDLEQIGKVIDSMLQVEREQTKTIAGFFHTTWQKKLRCLAYGNVDRSKN